MKLTLVRAFHERAYGDKQLQKSLTRLRVEFGAGIEDRLIDDDSIQPGPEHLLGAWITAMCQVVARRNRVLVTTSAE